MKDKRARNLRRTLRVIDELLRGEKDQLRQLRAHIAALIAQRGQAIAEVTQHRKVLKAERDIARDRLEMNVMMRVNQQMTTPQIARGLRRTEAKISRVIEDFRSRSSRPQWRVTLPADRRTSMFAGKD
jgi:hypothetical protein